MSILTYRYRIKDATSGKHLLRMAWACNTVWNFCQEVSLLAWRREKKWLTAFDLITLCAGASVELGLHSATLSEICREYVTKRQASDKRLDDLLRYTYRHGELLAPVHGR